MNEMEIEKRIQFNLDGNQFLRSNRYEIKNISWLENNDGRYNTNYNASVSEFIPFHKFLLFCGYHELLCIVETEDHNQERERKRRYGWTSSLDEFILFLNKQIFDDFLFGFLAVLKKWLPCKYKYYIGYKGILFCRQDANIHWLRYLIAHIENDTLTDAVFESIYTGSYMFHFVYSDLSDVCKFQSDVCVYAKTPYFEEDVWEMNENENENENENVVVFQPEFVFFINVAKQVLLPFIADNDDDGLNFDDDDVDFGLIHFKYRYPLVQFFQSVESFVYPAAFDAIEEGRQQPVHDSVIQFLTNPDWTRELSEYIDLNR